MTINITTVQQKLPLPVTRGQTILPNQISRSLNTGQAIYKFANRVLYSDLRDKDQTGLYFNNAPWYYDAYDTDDNWVSQVVKLPYRPCSPLPGSNLNTSAAPVGGWLNPVAAGDPSLTLYVEGCNLEYAIQIEVVTFNPVTGVVTYGAVTPSVYVNGLIGAYNVGSPWLSVYATDEVRIGLPDTTTDESLVLIDFYCRAARTAIGGNSTIPGFLGAVAIWDTPFDDFPSGSY